jgi:hypothetical protein
MLDAWNRAERCRDLAEECRRLAATTLSSQMRKRYLLMAKDYILLADIEEQAYLTERAIKDSIRDDESMQLLKAQLDQLLGFKKSE